MITLKSFAVLLLASFVATTPFQTHEELLKENAFLKYIRGQKFLPPKDVTKEVELGHTKLIETRDKHPDVGLTPIELITKYGYPVEVHENVETEDGYLLQLHRIPSGKNNSQITNKPVVFLMHGLLCSSADWVNMGPEKGFGYILADKGYDVWMGNARGNTWSRKHKVYSPDRDKSKFWDFSWHEIGYYDLPAMIDYVLKQTGQEKLHYVGHSQGTTAFFVMASERPEYNNKIRLMNALSPIVYMKNCPNIFIKFVAYLEGVASLIGKFIGLYEFFPSTDLMTEIGQFLCNDQAITQSICSNILFLIAGYNSEQLNATMIPVLLSNVPAGSATKQFFHYGQEITSGDFKKFDYGLIQNLIKYGSAKPPKYDISKVTAPVAMFYGDNDNLASEKDVNLLYYDLNNVVKKMKINGFNHLDFLWAIDVPVLLYNSVISLIERF